MVQEKNEGSLKRPVVGVVRHPDGSREEAPFTLDLDHVQNQIMQKYGRIHDAEVEIRAVRMPRGISEEVRDVIEQYGMK